MSRPAWSRAAGITFYSGHENKANYMGQDAIDARTDITADEINRTAMDLASCARTAPLLVARLTQDDTGTDDPTVHFCAFQPTGVSETDFDGGNPPAGYPEITRLGNGRIRVTFDATYEDDFGTEEPIVVRMGKGNGSGAVFAVVVPDLISDVAIEFRTYDAAGVALIDQTIAIEVW